MTQLFISQIGWMNVKEDYSYISRRLDNPDNFIEVTEVVNRYDEYRNPMEDLETKITLSKRHIIKIDSN